MNDTDVVLNTLAVIGGLLIADWLKDSPGSGSSNAPLYRVYRSRSDFTPAGRPQGAGNLRFASDAHKLRAQLHRKGHTDVEVFLSTDGGATWEYVPEPLIGAAPYGPSSGWASHDQRRWAAQS
jgi:hypothetical protein